LAGPFGWSANVFFEPKAKKPPFSFPPFSPTPLFSNHIAFFGRPRGRLEIPFGPSSFSSNVTNLVFYCSWINPEGDCLGVGQSLGGGRNFSCPFCGPGAGGPGQETMFLELWCYGGVLLLGLFSPAPPPPTPGRTRRNPCPSVEFFYPPPLNHGRRQATKPEENRPSPYPLPPANFPPFQQ